MRRATYVYARPKQSRTSSRAQMVTSHGRTCEVRLRALTSMLNNLGARADLRESEGRAEKVKAIVCVLKAMEAIFCDDSEGNRIEMLDNHFLCHEATDYHRRMYMVACAPNPQLTKRQCTAVMRLIGGAFEDSPFKTRYRKRTHLTVMEMKAPRQLNAWRVSVAVKLMLQRTLTYLRSTNEVHEMHEAHEMRECDAARC